MNESKKYWFRNVPNIEDAYPVFSSDCLFALLFKTALLPPLVLANCPAL